MAKMFGVFAYGLNSFGTANITKNEQEAICQSLHNHTFHSCFDKSGNYIFTTSQGVAQLKTDVCSALSQYLISTSQKPLKGTVVVDRNVVEDALIALKDATNRKFGNQFDRSKWTVRKNGERWRPGCVYLDLAAPLSPNVIDQLLAFRNRELEVLYLHQNVVGVLKYDPQSPRIPWGKASGPVADVVGISPPLATARSATVIEGLLR